MNLKLKLIAMSTSILSLTGCTTALTVADFMFTPIGTGIHVYYERDEINAPYIEAEKKFSENKEKKAPINDNKIKWAQPINKKVACKIPVFIDPDRKRKIYWDGSCKSGYAHGLGREIHLDTDYHKEVIVEHDKSKIDEYGAYLARDYFSKRTIRGYLTGTFGSHEGYYLLETIVDDKRTGEARMKQEEIIKRINEGAYKTFESKLGGIIITTEKQGLRFARLQTENVIHNYPSKITVISLASDTMDESMGFGNKRVLSKFIINGKPYYFWLQNGDRKELGGIIGSGTDYFEKAEDAIKSAEADFNKYYNFCSEAEEKYLFRLKTSTKKPAGLSDRIYYEIENYYSDDLMQRIANTQNKEVTVRNQNSQVKEFEQRQKDAEARASRIRSEQMLNQLYQNNPTPQISTPSFEVQPLESNTPSVYRSQRVNDNMAIIQKVK